VGYELYVLPVPRGGDLEESAEALLTLLRSGHDRFPRSAGATGRVETVVATLRTECGLDVATPSSTPTSWRCLRSEDGLQITVAPAFVRLQLPFDWIGEHAEVQFERLFEVLGRIVIETGWQVYDPQDAARVSVDERGRRGTLDIYLSVMDQLRSGGTSA
jgi:hypothetical protein